MHDGELTEVSTAPSIISLERRDIAYAGAQYSGRLIEAPGEVRSVGLDLTASPRMPLPEDASRALVEQYLEQYI